ncbi:uncharacterized protein LOC144079200 [Stigmatopora argus]
MMYLCIALLIFSTGLLNRKERGPRGPSEAPQRTFLMNLEQSCVAMSRSHEPTPPIWWDGMNKSPGRGKGRNADTPSRIWTAIARRRDDRRPVSPVQTCKGRRQTSSR